MKNLTHFIVILIPAILASCSEDPPVGGGRQSPAANNSNSWLIPESEVLDGGPGKDGIPSIDNPKFVEVNNANFLSDDDLVIGYKFDTVVRAYPHLILDWHEIVNDRIGDHLFAITYCPLTGTAINWSRDIKGKIPRTTTVLTTTFGSSGLLFNSNLMPYDRATNSTWSQMRLDCVNGFLVGTEAPFFSIVETTWKTWRELYPETEVMSLITGFIRNYGSYPFTSPFTSRGDYRIEEYLIFPVSNIDTRLPRKERVLGVVNGGQAKVYRFVNFSDGLKVIEDVVGDEKIAVIGSLPDNFLVAYKTEDQILSIQDDAIVDQLGNTYDIFGTVTAGPDSLQRLEPTISFIGYWFSWGSFYPNIDIYTSDDNQ